MYQALVGSQPAAAGLQGIEAGVAWLHAHYADLPPHVLLPEPVAQTRLLTRALRGPQRIADRARLCSALGEVAGLRAWLHALAARSHAALGAAADFDRAWRATGTDPDAGVRRHGMDVVDGRLDVGYYAGGAWGSG